MNNAPENWYKCDIDRKILKRLMRRQNKSPALYLGGHLIILILLAGVIVYGWGQSWVIPVIIIYSCIWCFGNAVVHETCHGTPFKSRWMNELALWISGWMVQMEPVSVRWAHAGHHSYTHFDEKDSELALANPMTWGEFVIQLCGLGSVHRYYYQLLGLCFNRPTQLIKDSIPVSQMNRICLNARLIVGSYFIIIAASVIYTSWLPVMLFILPRFIGAPFYGIFRVAQHTGLAMNIQDHRKTTRTFYTHPVIRFLYLNMNYHVEHHMFPLVPFYNLPELHLLVKDQLPEPLPSLTATYKEIFLAVSQQQKNPGYFIPKQIPHTDELNNSIA